MTQVTLEEAQARLPELIETLGAGDGLTITHDDRPIARLVGIAHKVPHAVPGRCQGMLTILADDDEHLRDFADYMP